MPKIPSLWFVIQKELFTFWSLLWTSLTAVVYISLTIFLLNSRLVVATIQQPFPLQDKVTIIFSLFAGIFTAFSPLDSMFVIVGAVLVGLNVVLIAKTIYQLEHAGRVRLSVGGATIVSLIAVGCSSCGFSILSLIGLGTSFSFLPFHGIGLHLLAIGLLTFSLWYMLKKLRDSVYCKR